jgi:hypothetical protein
MARFATKRTVSQERIEIDRAAWRIKSAREGGGGIA